MKFIDLTGQQFNRLKVIKYTGRDKFEKSLWLCGCSCGKEKIVEGSNLKSGDTKSCGCLKKELAGRQNYKHGHAQKGNISKIYRTWAGMISRCTNIKEKNYRHYGGRIPPITVCKRWSDTKNGFQNFLKDMGEPPTNKHQIDRINNNKGYYKSNCRWVTSKENNRNRRSNHLLKYKRKELCFSEWEEITGIKQTMIRRRIKDGWSIKRALTTSPLNIRNKINE